jgi:hypothetical protein
MTSVNLAILITPCIFRPKYDDVLKELLDTRKLIEVSKILITQQSRIFQNLNYLEDSDVIEKLL